ncbi:MAG: nuclear transport factor 2 family protein [Pseudomonadota bacterium]
MNVWDGAAESERGKEVLQLFHPDYRLYDNGVLTVAGLDELTLRIKTLRADDPRFAQHIVASLAQGDEVAFRWEATSQKQPPFSGMTWARFEDGRPIEVHQHWVNPHFQDLVAR